MTNLIDSTLIARFRALSRERGPCEHCSESREITTGKPVNLHEAKTRLSELVERAAGGEEIVIAKAGKPRTRLVPLHRPGRKRRPGAWRGRVRIARDFEAPLPPEVQAAFERDAPIDPPT